MDRASFHIHRDPRRSGWVVIEEGHREIGGVFTTLIAALDFVGEEARRFRGAKAVIEFS
jgi:hypothetical protein